MIELNTHYLHQPFWGKPKLKVVSIKIPESWNELTRKQLLGISEVLTQNGMDEYDMNLGLAKVLIGKSQLLKEIDPLVFTNDIVPHLEFIKKSCDLSNQLIPYFLIGGKLFHGPKSYISNLRFGEFDALERALHAFLESPDDIQLLYEFVAILYRPKKKGYDLVKDEDDDLRVPYVENWCKNNAKHFAEWELEIPFCYAILFWYRGCRAYLIDRFEPIFNQSGATENEDADPSYFGLMRLFAKQGIYGTMENVERLFIYTAMHDMLCTMEENEQRKAQETQSND